MQVQTRIEQIIKATLEPQHLELTNESHLHAGGDNRETHFKLLVVAKGFEGKTLIQRHQWIYALLDHELKSGVHALALHTYTPQEWLDALQRQAAAPKSPPCAGGGKS